jgi:hypothetical protein
MNIAVFRKVNAAKSSERESSRAVTDLLVWAEFPAFMVTPAGGRGKGATDSYYLTFPVSHCLIVSCSLPSGGLIGA